MERKTSNRTRFKNLPKALDEQSPKIKLAHGEGGKLTRDLLKNHILPCLQIAEGNIQDDSAILDFPNGDLAVSTDSYVVSPLFFPGGDIGTLAVTGTLNDLAVSGAQPKFLTLSLIIEEGLPIELLEHVLRSAAETAKQQRVCIVAGDTKVVPWGTADSLFISTTGIGVREKNMKLGPDHICAGDELIVTGPIGQHGIAVLCCREELSLDPIPQSDCGPVGAMAEKLVADLGSNLHAMRDATRGGVSAVLHEWAESGHISISLDESSIPLTPAVRGSCELLGLDPLHVANEGTMVVAVAAGFGDQAIASLRELSEGSAAALIGKVENRGNTPVTVRRALGQNQPLDEPLGAPLPRIC